MLNFRKTNKHLLPSFLLIAFMSNLSIASVTLPASNSSNKLSQSYSNSDLSEKKQIEKAILADAQRENWQPKIGTISVVDDYALATTYDENVGGETILKKQQGVWQVIGGTGGAFSRAEELVQLGGVPVTIARRLLQVRASQER
ncbi:hypothetical protein C7B80_25055 [Cyanosarcina cf. burmensis CCALA 770]|nr:hypothetical protein C7B80_25055 [Cyanosarcina cf. burmensis CCALA 770]